MGERDGFAALSEYDQQLFHADEERVLWITRYLITNQIAFSENRLLDCPDPVQQITLFAAPAPDAHLEAQYDDQQSGFEDS